MCLFVGEAFPATEAAGDYDTRNGESRLSQRNHYTKVNERHDTVYSLLECELPLYSLSSIV